MLSIEQILTIFLKNSSNEELAIMIKQFMSCQEKLEQVLVSRYAYLQEAISFAKYLSLPEVADFCSKRLDLLVDKYCELAKLSGKNSAPMSLYLSGMIDVSSVALDVINRDSFAFYGLYYHHYMSLIFGKLAIDGLYLKEDSYRLQKLDFLIKQVTEDEGMLHHEFIAFLNLIGREY